MSQHSANNRPSIFDAVKYRREIGQIEFSYFRRQAIPRIPAVCKSIKRFDDLKSGFSFWIDKEGGDDHLQINFGKRKMWAKGLDGGVAIEKGPSLVYSLSSIDGSVATVLYPAASPLGQVNEDHIFLRVGRYGGIDLLNKLRSDLEDLVAYAFVSSLELEPSLRDKLRFWWLRKTYPQSLDKKFFRPLAPNAMMASASKFTVTSLIIALLRPIGLLLAYLLLVYFGFANLTDHLH